ncbi:MAG: magnesium transporter CorA family protein [Candidatus Goldbacteria bacterium]|nr:magnesium transporter CorA family protein [Candidatus Goldiibacteriota bacterium]
MVRSLIYADNKIFQENELSNILKYIKKKENIIWIDLESPTENEIDFLIDEFNFHTISIEDAILPNDHPKVDLFEDYMFLTLYSINIMERIDLIELNIFIGKNYIITFHEEKINSLNKLFNALNKTINGGESNGNVFKKGADRILHKILNALVDEYYPAIEKIETKIAILEDKLVEEREEKIMEDILEQKKNVLILRKLFYLERQILNKIIKEKNICIKEINKTYFRDIYDHFVNMQETIEIIREIIPSLIETYHTMTSKKLNKSLHRLTIVATIALPMLAIASYYGMNVEMPEFKWGIWGWLFSLFLMLISTIAIYILLKIKKWF